MDPLRRRVVLPQVSSSVPCALESSGFLVVAPSYTKFVRERRCEEEEEEAFFEINQGRIENRGALGIYSCVILNVFLPHEANLRSIPEMSMC